jgi:hypothetical protein
MSLGGDHVCGDRSFLVVECAREPVLMASGHDSVQQRGGAVVDPDRRGV